MEAKDPKLSPDKYLQLLELIQLAHEASSVDDMRNIYLKAKAYTNIVGLLYGYAPKLDTDGLTKNRFIAFGFPVEWTRRYHAENLALKDPVVAYAVNHGNAVFEWSEAYREASPEIAYSLLAELTDGEVYGMTTSALNMYNRLPTITSVMFGRTQPSEGNLFFYRTLLPQLNEIIARPHFRDRPDLTKKELDVLEWVNAGKTYWETGKILEISERTVKFHMNNIAQKLGANNKAQIVVRAAQLGLISPPIEPSN